MKKRAIFALCLLAMLLCACGQTRQSPSETPEPTAEADSATQISLQGETASVKGGGASVSGGTVSIGAVGEYRVSGTLSAGQIVVDTGEDAMDVTLILDGADVTCPSGPAILVKQAKNVHLVLAPGSENRVTSGVREDLNTYNESRSGAAIFSEDDLTIEGEGQLAVSGYLNNGITCKDDLKLKGGTVNVTAANNGLRASESISISGGTVNVTAANDGVKTSSDVKEGKGYIDISGGSLTVRSGGDSLDAVTELRVSGGSIRTESRQELEAVSSRKGLKAGTLLSISGGSLEIHSDGDGLHCDGDVSVTGGSLLIVASTGVQSGVKDSGRGDILLSGGKLLISAGKRALKAEGSARVTTELLALGTSDKQTAPDTEGQAFVFAALEGMAGETLQIAGESFDLPQRFSWLFYTAPSLSAGQPLSFQLGQQQYSVEAK